MELYSFCKIRFRTQTKVCLRFILTGIAFLFCLVFTTANAKGAPERVTIVGDDIPITEVFEAIHRQTGYSFVYEQKLLDRVSPVTISAKDMPVTAVLDKCLKDQALSYKIKYKTIIIVKAMKPAEGASLTNPLPPITVQGRVTDSNNQPLVGVTITVKGNSEGTTTDLDGNYSITVPDDNAILQFSYLGFVTVEQRVGEATILNITLNEDLEVLDEVVIVGYGTQKKSDVTGAVASYNADDIEQRPLARVDQALVGQMAGVQVKQTTGIPGQGFSIQVRGAGSITAGNEPLYVVDGFPLAQASPNERGAYQTGNPLDNINPNDIASVQVLKDASAAAIYGSRAANGVVLITTKQGREGKPTISFNSQIGYSEPSKKLDILSAEEWVDRAIEMINAEWVASGTGRNASQTTEERRQILGLAPGEVDRNLMIDDRWLQPGHPGLYYIDWQDEAFRKGLTQNYQLSATGGNEFVKYYVSGDYINQKGTTLGVDYVNYSARANIEVNASKKLKFGLNLAPSYSLGNDPGVTGKSGIMRMLLTFVPVQESPPGSVNVGNNGQYNWSSPDADVISRLVNNIGLTKRSRTLGTVFAEYQLLDGLTFKTTANLDNTNSSRKGYNPYFNAGTVITRRTNPGLLTSGSLQEYNKQTFVSENTLSFNKVINDVHNLSVLAGASYNYDKLAFTDLSSNGGFVSTEITTLNGASGITGGTTETENILLSYFGRVQYGYDGKYLLSASLRRDGSSRFGANSKWGWFPAASVGWRISEENFLRDNEVISELKIRASWGKSGNYSIGDYSSLPLLGTYNYTFNNNSAFGQAPGGVINPDLGWEKSETTDIGLDLGLLGGRIFTSFDYYTKLNSDLLLNVPIPANTGFTTYMSNAGKVRNKGWELELTTRNFTGAFQWTTSVNLSHNSNKVVSLSGGQDQIYIPTRWGNPHSILKVGEPAYSISVVKQIGILSQEDIDNGAALYGTEVEGDPKFLDANNDGTIDANDRVIVGHPTPNFFWGMTNSFRYKGFDLNILIQGQSGGSIYSLAGYSLYRAGQSYDDNVYGFFRDRWKSPEDPGAGQVGKAYSDYGTLSSTSWLYSSDYWRIRSITLGYDLGSVLKSRYLKRTRIYVTAENFFGHDSYLGGFNPEAANEDISGSSIFHETGDYGGLPLPKSLIFGLNVTF